MELELRSRSPLPLSNSHPHPLRRFLRLGIDLMDFLKKIKRSSKASSCFILSDGLRIRDSNLTESKKTFKAFRLEALEILKTRKTQEVSGSSRNISNKIKTLRGRI